MLEKTDSAKLIEMLGKNVKTPQCVAIFSDNELFLHLAQKQAHGLANSSAHLFEGKQASAALVEHLSQGSMFCAPAPAVFLVASKTTKKQWEEELVQLSRLPMQLETSLYIFAPVSLRNVLTGLEKIKPLKKSFLCYSPADYELSKASMALMDRYSFSQSFDKQVKIQNAQKAVENYSGDLLACELHYERMEKGGISFEDAFVSMSNVNSFDVVDAVAKGKVELVERRLQQCAEQGEDAGAIFAALIYFLKQVVHVRAAVREAPLKIALERLSIPFPSHGRIQSALNNIPEERLFSFFEKAPDIEMTLRTQKNPVEILSIELISLFA